VDSQGYRYYYPLTGGDDGVRAYLGGSGTTNSDGFVVASVQMAPDFSNNAGLLQVGETKSLDYSWDCFPLGGNGTKVFVEYETAGSTTYHCGKSSSQLDSFGYGNVFSLSYSGSTWTARQNDGAIWCATPGGGGGCTDVSLGFTDAYSLAFAEGVFDPSAGGAPPSLAMTYGPAGDTPWEYTSDGGASWTVIGSSNHSAPWNSDTDGDGDGDWYVYADPSPFNINFHGGYGS
jgi:hypothetical protein